jgi:hypothetical protein
LAKSTTSPAAPLPPPSVDSLIEHRRPLRNVHEAAIETVTPLNRVALWITIRVGSMGFFLVILGSAGASGVAVRSADGLCILAVHF